MQYLHLFRKRLTHQDTHTMILKKDIEIKNTNKENGMITQTRTGTHMNKGKYA